MPDKPVTDRNIIKFLILWGLLAGILGGLLCSISLPFKLSILVGGIITAAFVIIAYIIFH